MLIQDQQFVFICTVIALSEEEKKWRCGYFLFRLQLHTSGWTAPPPPSGLPGWKGRQGPSRCERSAGGFASWSSLETEEEGMDEQEEEEEETLVSVELLTWTGFWESWGILNEVWRGDWTDFLSHWQKEKQKKNSDLKPETELHCGFISAFALSFVMDCIIVIIRLWL